MAEPAAGTGHLLLLEIVVICYLGDLVWQIVQALQQLPVPAREPVGRGLGYTDFGAAVSFCSEATGWSHGLLAAVGLTIAAVYSAALAAAVWWAWRRQRPLDQSSRSSTSIRDPGGAIC
ncbi:MAG: hypothetical protein ACLPUO_09475 [Streptosporangiaceae bacterium]